MFLFSYHFLQLVINTLVDFDIVFCSWISSVKADRETGKFWLAMKFVFTVHLLSSAQLTA